MTITTGTWKNYNNVKSIRTSNAFTGWIGWHSGSQKAQVKREKERRKIVEQGAGVRVQGGKISVERLVVLGVEANRLQCRRLNDKELLRDVF